MRRRSVAKTIADESAEQLRMNPVAAAERLRERLLMQSETYLKAASRAVADQNISAALLKAMEAWRMYVGFSHELSRLTGRNIYEVRSVLHERVGSEFLRKRLLALRYGAPTAVELPAQAKEILTAIESQQQPKAGPKFVNLEDLTEEQKRALCESESGYQSRSRQRTGPSPDY